MKRSIAESPGLRSLALALLGGLILTSGPVALATATPDPPIPIAQSIAAQGEVCTETQDVPGVYTCERHTSGSTLASVAPQPPDGSRFRITPPTPTTPVDGPCFTRNGRRYTTKTHFFNRNWVCESKIYTLTMKMMIKGKPVDLMSNTYLVTVHTRTESRNLRVKFEVHYNGIDSKILYPDMRAVLINALKQVYPYPSFGWVDDRGNKGELKLPDWATDSQQGYRYAEASFTASVGKGVVRNYYPELWLEGRLTKVVAKLTNAYPDVVGKKFSPARCDNNAVPGLGSGCVTPNNNSKNPNAVYTIGGQADRTQYKRHVRTAIQSGLPSNIQRVWEASGKTNDANHRESCSKKPSVAGRQCDEYPFKSTYQGAAAHKGMGRSFPSLDCKFPAGKPTTGAAGYSHCMIASGHNEAGGRELGAFYYQQRVLNKDWFHVRA